MRTRTAQLLTTSEVAEWFGRPEQTLVQWRYRREGPDYLRIGRTIRYDAGDVQRWLNDQRIEAAAQ